MKIYLMTDMEGVAGVVDFEDRVSDTRDNFETRRRCRRLLTGEVNAAADELFRAGADQVIVDDAHGVGCSIDVERLDPRVELIHGRGRPTWLPLLNESCDAAVFIGAHARAGAEPACLHHTLTDEVRCWSVHGVEIGEIGLVALAAGEYGVPLIFLSGDRGACDEAEALVPGIVTAAVKRGLGREVAVTCTPGRARQSIRRGIRRAMAEVGHIEPLRFERPYRFIEERFEACWNDESPPMPGVRVLDPRRRQITADSFNELMHKMYPQFLAEYTARSLADDAARRQGEKE